MYLQFFSHFHETLPFNYDSPVPEGGMGEGGVGTGVSSVGHGEAGEAPGRTI